MTVELVIPKDGGYLTGVGSRQAPRPVRQLFTLFVQRLATRHAVIWRSGHAPGMDAAVEAGTGDAINAPEIYLPWQGFGGAYAPGDDGRFILPFSENPTVWEKAREIAKEVIPYWDNMKPSHKALHTRNAYQVLGRSLTEPSEAIYFWAKPTRTEGRVAGGTNTAVQIGRKYEVPLFNLYDSKVLEAISVFLDLPVDIEKMQEGAR